MSEIEMAIEAAKYGGSVTLFIATVVGIVYIITKLDEKYPNETRAVVFLLVVFFVSFGMMYGGLHTR